MGHPSWGRGWIAPDARVQGAHADKKPLCFIRRARVHPLRGQHGFLPEAAPHKGVPYEDVITLLDSFVVRTAIVTVMKNEKSGRVLRHDMACNFYPFALGAMLKATPFLLDGANQRT